ADHLRVGYAALGARPGGGVVRIAVASPLALVEVGADREIAVMGEPSRRIDVELVPAREMMDEDDAREGAGTRGLGRVSRDRRSPVAVDGDVLAGHASVE